MAAALKKAFAEMDEEILAESRRDGLRDGSTGVVVLRLGMFGSTCHTCCILSTLVRPERLASTFT